MRILTLITALMMVVSAWAQPSAYLTLRPGTGATVTTNVPGSDYTVNATGSGGGDVTQAGQNNLVGSNTLAGVTKFNTAIYISNNIVTGIANQTNSANIQSATMNVTGQFNGAGNGLFNIPETGVASLTTDLAAKVTQGGTGLMLVSTGGVFGITNKDGSFCLTNQINHSFSLITTNGDLTMSNAVVGAYIAFTNGVFFCSSNATIGGMLSVLSGTSTTVSNLVNNGWFTNFGGFTNTGPMRVDGNISGALSNYWNFAVVGGEAVPTNILTSSVVDFAKAEQTFQTNNVINILGFTGKDATGKMTASTLLKLTNSAGLGSAFQTNTVFPAGTHVIGNSVITNWAEWWVEFNQPTGPTNAYSLGGW